MTKQTPQNPRKISRIQIRDVLSIEEATIDDLDGGLVISGQRGAGKTSILHALEAAFKGNARTEMVRKGANEGEVLMVLDDGTSVRRRISNDGVKAPEVIDPSGKKVSSPASALQRLMPALNLNPVEFLKMEPKAQAKLLASVFPVDLQMDELIKLTKGQLNLSSMPTDLNGLEMASFALKLATKARTELNGEIKAIQSQYEADSSRVPSNFDVESARAESTESLAKELAEITRHNNNHDQVVEKQSLNARNIAGLQAQIAELQKQLDAELLRKTTIENWLSENPKRDATEVTNRISNLDAKRKTLSFYDSSVRQQALLDAQRERANEVDVVVKNLKALPEELVRRANVPIPGLTLEDGVIHINGLPLGNLSDGEQLQVAIRIAAAGARDLRVICIDGAEKLSNADQDMMLTELENEGFQVFMTRVADCDLQLTDTMGNSVDGAYNVNPVRGAFHDSMNHDRTSRKLPGSEQSGSDEQVASIKSAVEKADKPVKSVLKSHVAAFNAAPVQDDAFGELSL